MAITNPSTSVNYRVNESPDAIQKRSGPARNWDVTIFNGMVSNFLSIEWNSIRLGGHAVTKTEIFDEVTFCLSKTGPCADISSQIKFTEEVVHLWRQFCQMLRILGQ